MQPEILMRYPLEDTEDVEINNLSATMCFPTGIKICYCEQEKRPEKMDDYLTLMTNRKGDRLFIMTYHFYVKMNKSEFDKKSKNNALELKLKKCDELIKIKDDEDMRLLIMKKVLEDYLVYLKKGYEKKLVSFNDMVNQTRELSREIFSIDYLRKQRKNYY